MTSTARAAGRTAECGAAHGHSCLIRLPDDAHPVATARRRLRAVLRLWELHPETVDTIELVVCELATNAVRHTDGPVDIAVLMCEHRQELLVRVRDRDPRPPRELHATDEDEHGRGLDIVDALATRHGHTLMNGHKTVWAAVAVRAPSGPAIPVPVPVPVAERLSA
jgi:anti-sigma regulatory factor (Ser/Thr protein kinase)